MKDPQEAQILEEIEEDYEPREEEIKEYAAYLGVNLKEDPELLWIVKEGLKASVPSPWKPCRTLEGSIFYFNFETKQSTWEHPLDQYYKELYKSEKNKKIVKIKKAEKKLTQELIVTFHIILEYGKSISTKV